MSWLFSQALVAAYSADICSDGEPSVPSSGNPTQQAYCAPDKMTAFSRLSRFGMTFRPLTEDRGAALLMSYLAAFPARTSAPPERAPASTANAPACGDTWPELSVKYCLDSFSWKTHRSLWEEVLPWSSVTLPRWGMTRNGHVSAHPTAERPISATVSGLLPTPDTVCRDNKKLTFNRNATSQSGRSLATYARTWPTPRSCSAMAATITQESAWSDNRFPNLETMVGRSIWSPPTKSYHKGSGPQMLRSDGKMRGDRLDYATERTPEGQPTGGQLNPTWVEWLMGWPLGWTDLKPLAMDRFREWQQQHSLFFQETDE